MGSKNRGMLLESIINRTIDLYRKNDLAIFHKRNTPIKISKVHTSENNKHLFEGIANEKSTVDYYGLYQGIFIAFEAKSTEKKSLPLSNIAKHQQEYLELINQHCGIGFYIILFKDSNLFYYLHATKVKKLKSKSITIEFLEQQGFKLALEFPGIVDFLALIKKNHKLLK